MPAKRKLVQSLSTAAASLTGGAAPAVQTLRRSVRIKPSPPLVTAAPAAATAADATEPDIKSESKSAAKAKSPKRKAVSDGAASATTGAGSGGGGGGGGGGGVAVNVAPPILNWSEVGNGASAAAPASSYSCTGSLHGFKATSKPVIAFVETVQKKLSAAYNPAMSKRMSGYMRNHHPFIGLQQPQRLAITKPILKSDVAQFKTQEQVFEATKALWALPEREYHLTALELLGENKQLLTADALPHVEEIIKNKSWWDSIDWIASNVVGPLVQRFPGELTPHMDRWIGDPYLWIRRSAILYQLKYKSQTDRPRLFSYIDKTKHESDFFIRKAIGWVLREYSKTEPKVVRKYIDQNSKLLSPLSIKEGGKYC